MSSHKRARQDVNLTETGRQKSAVDQAVQELVCPISYALPIDPVLAEDLKIYERSEIEKWLLNNSRSPLTNEAMGSSLRSMPQIKNMIRAMVQSGVLTGDKVDAWQAKLKEEKEAEFKIAELRQQVEAGDGGAMNRLGIAYQHGMYLLKRDESKAFEWFSSCVFVFRFIHPLKFPQPKNQHPQLPLRGPFLFHCH